MYRLLHLFGEQRKCPFWDEKKKLDDEMSSADLLIFTTAGSGNEPEYDSNYLKGAVE